MHGLKLAEYQRDILSKQVSNLRPGEEGKRNLVELIEFVSAFDAPHPQVELEMMYPELLNEEIDSAPAIDMYRQFAQESLDMLDRYPLVKAIVS